MKPEELVNEFLKRSDLVGVEDLIKTKILALDQQQKELKQQISEMSAELNNKNNLYVAVSNHFQAYCSLALEAQQKYESEKEG
jgi:hypothetical protein